MTGATAPGQGRRAEPDRLAAVAVFDTQFQSSLAFMRSLARQGVPLIACGPSSFSLGRFSPYCSEFLKCPSPTEVDAFSNWLKARLAEGRFALVAPTSDLLSFHCARVRDSFPEPYRAAVPTREALERCLIKPRFHDRCAALGLPAPQTWLPTSLEEAQALATELPYPVMIKPRSHLGIGMAYRGAIVADADAFRAAFHRLPASAGQNRLMSEYPELDWPMVQRFDRSAWHRVYSLCGYRDARKGVIAGAVVCKTAQWPPGIGIGTCFEALDSVAVTAAGIAIADGLEHFGLFQIELIDDGKQLRPIDFNPRAFAMLSFDIARGNDLPWLWYLGALGQSLELQPAPRSGMQWRHDVPFHSAHWTRILGGPARRAHLRRYRAEMAHHAVSAMEGQPLHLQALFALSLLRHPGSLVRPYWRKSLPSFVGDEDDSASVKQRVD